MDADDLNDLNSSQNVEKLCPQAGQKDLRGEARSAGQVRKAEAKVELGT
jgi:hypothetical protein